MPRLHALKTWILAEQGAGARGWAGALCGGALLGALSRGGAEIVGAAPATEIATCAALATAFALGAPRALRGGLVARAAPLLPALLLLTAEPALAWLGPAAEGVGLALRDLRAALALLTVAAALPFARVAAGTSPGAAALVAGSLGLALGLALPPALGALLAALLAAWLWRPAAPAPAAVPWARALSGAAVIAAAAFQAALGWQSLRANFDPSPAGAAATALGALAGAALGARLSPAGPGALARSAAALLLVAGASVAGLSASGGRVVTALGAWTLDLPPKLSVLALDLPLLWVALLPGAALGLAWGGARGRWPWAGLALGLWIAAGGPGDGSTLLWAASALGLASAMASASRGAQLSGVGLVALAVLLAALRLSPHPSAGTRGLYALLRDPMDLDHDAEVRARLTEVYAAATAEGSAAVRAPSETLERAARRALSGPRSLDLDRVEPLHLELDGLVAEADSRAGDAEALAGALGAALAPRDSAALLLGDDTGRALRAFEALSSGVVRVAVASPGLLRAAAALDPGAERAWQRPGVALLAAHPAWALHSSGARGLILEVGRAPWADGARMATGPRHLAALRRRLRPDGIYVLCLHLGLAPRGGATRLLEGLADAFSSVQLWLPPRGADSLIVVAGEQRPAPGRLVAALENKESLLRGLGLTGAEGLLGYAVGDRDALARWQEAERAAAAPDPMHLSPALRTPPSLHLAGLAAFTARPEAIWDLSEAADQARAGALGEGIEARRLFLELLGRASAGDMEAMFNNARSLLARGPEGSAALDPLIAPHLARGREALRRAGQEGLSSPAWEDARRYAYTAQMLHPQSPAPPVLLGDIALAQGQLQQAEERYQAALKLDPAAVPAMDGLARVARTRGDLEQTERWARQASAVAPRLWTTWQNLGVALLESGRPDQAEEALQRAAGLADDSGVSPLPVAPHLALAQLYLDRGKPARALVEAERAVQSGVSGQAWYLRGRAHFDLGRLEDAEEDFRKAVLAAPGLLEARGGIGQIRAMKGDWAAAAEAFKAVLAQDPSNAAARQNLAQVQAELDEEARLKTGDPR